MLELTSETFHLETEKSNFLLCIFYQKSTNTAEEVLCRILDNDQNIMSATVACIDTDKCSDVAHMFGIDTKEPAILMMREQIVLYCETLSSLDKHSAFSMIKQISSLDMNKIKNDMELERQSHAHLFGRSVCPTAKRTRGK